VISSEVTSHHSDDGTTYGINILYSYNYNGKEYKSNRYNFIGGSSSGYNSKARIAQKYSPYSKHICYVNPKEPQKSVLNRSIFPSILLGLIPLIFILVGIGCCIGFLKKERSPISNKSYYEITAGRNINDVNPSNKPIILEPVNGPIKKLLGLAIFSIIWDGFVVFLLYQTYENWKSKAFEFNLIIITIVFTLIGIGLLVGIIYYILALYNPRPKLLVSSNEVPLGGSIELAWRITGDARRIERLSISLEAREEAIYTRGTDTCTDKSTFLTINILDTNEYRKMTTGRAKFEIPLNTMHSFSAINNKIIWQLKVHGTIDNFPDINEEFPFTIIPVIK